MSGLLPALGGGANSVVSLAAGGLSGVVAMSALIATGVVPVGGSAPAGPPNLAVTACKGQGLVTIARPGDQMLATGKTADGVWLRVYVPGPTGEGWVRASDVKLLADGPLPVADCGRVAAAPTSPTATPAPSATTAPTATATPTATPGPTPSPTPNRGPVFATQPYSDVATINTNPLGTGTCRFTLGAGLTTKASDPDGVAAIQLWVRKPGVASYTRLGHDFTRNGTTWSNIIKSKDDGVTTAGTLSWFAVAVDGRNAQTKSSVRSLKVVRCDTEATITGGINLVYDSFNGAYRLDYYGCGSNLASIPWLFNSTDADGLSKAALTYTARDPSGFAFMSGAISLSHSGSTWTGSSATFDAYVYNTDTIQWRVTTTDRYGGKTTHTETNSLFTNQTC